MLTNEQQKALAIIAEAAVECEAKTGFPGEVSAAQAVFESGYLTRYTGNWNCFGLKANGHGIGKKLVTTHEVLHSQRVEKDCWFESYNSLADCFADHARLLISGEPYQNAWCGFVNSGDIDQFVRDFGPIYATAEGYAEMIISEMHSPSVTAALSNTTRSATIT